MKKLLVAVMLLSGIIILAGCTSTTELNKESTQVKKPQKELIGGWYPIFFKKYDQSKVDSIKNSIISGKAKRVTITYDRNKVLAEKILANIQAKLNFAVEMNHVALKDGTAKYNHEQVTVTVYQR
ncbi:MAG: hypothetical protein GY756_25230 [bacterium]|nr:hypothetical protein [bacterium]